MMYGIIGHVHYETFFHRKVIAFCRYAVSLRIFGISSSEKREEKLRDDSLKYLKVKVQKLSQPTLSPKQFKKTQFTLK